MANSADRILNHFKPSAVDAPLYHGFLTLISVLDPEDLTSTANPATDVLSWLAGKLGSTHPAVKEVAKILNTPIHFYSRKDV